MQITRENTETIVRNMIAEGHGGSLTEYILAMQSQIDAMAAQDADGEIARLQKIERAAITLRSRCIVEGVYNPKMKGGYHVEVRTDPEAWKQFWDTLPIDNLAVKDGLKQED